MAESDINNMNNFVEVTKNFIGKSQPMPCFTSDKQFRRKKKPITWSTLFIFT